MHGRLFVSFLITFSFFSIPSAYADHEATVVEKHGEQGEQARAKLKGQSDKCRAEIAEQKKSLGELKARFKAADDNIEGKASTAQLALVVSGLGLAGTMYMPRNVYRHMAQGGAGLMALFAGGEAISI